MQPTIEARLRKKLGVRIRKARERRGLTQMQLAIEMNVPSKDVISRWEVGRYAPSLIMASRLVKALGISLDELTREVV